MNRPASWRRCRRPPCPVCREPGRHSSRPSRFWSASRNPWDRPACRLRLKRLSWRCPSCRCPMSSLCPPFSAYPSTNRRPCPCRMDQPACWRRYPLWAVCREQGRRRSRACQPWACRFPDGFGSMGYQLGLSRFPWTAIRRRCRSWSHCPAGGWTRLSRYRSIDRRPGHPASGHPASGHPASGHPASGRPASGRLDLLGTCPSIGRSSSLTSDRPCPIRSVCLFYRFPMAWRRWGLFQSLCGRTPRGPIIRFGRFRFPLRLGLWLAGSLAGVSRAFPVALRSLLVRRPGVGVSVGLSGAVLFVLRGIPRIIPRLRRRALIPSGCSRRLVLGLVTRIRLTGILPVIGRRLFFGIAGSGLVGTLSLALFRVRAVLVRVARVGLRTAIRTLCPLNLVVRVVGSLFPRLG